MLRARAALSAACPCSLNSMNYRRCRLSTARAAKWYSTFRRKPVFRELPYLCSHEADEQLTAMAYLSDRMRSLAATGSPKAAELLEKAGDLDEALAKDPSDVATVLGAWARARALWSEVMGASLS